ncbi:MAG TPA: BTAD domain-containing putative transcriptional regulator [Anaeromyxobacteraceae bacterium]|nr:BTAD domain-containing putative transcriptional regulator [Anaeromyxobacteraceae bacterium]
MARARTIHGGVLGRERLFALLDRARGKAIWIAGPPGSGKTTLVSSWLGSRRVSSLWYPVRPEDGDLASFFYELGARAGRRRTPLPPFTPEYQGGEGAFARRFFRELTRGRRRPWALVLDDLERVAASPSFLDILRDALEDLSPGTRAILVSREQPPEGFTRLVANGVLSVVGGDALRLTPGEALAIARAHAPGRTPEELDRLCRRSAGWAAGLVLLAFSPADAADSDQEPKALFAYLASELLDRADPDTRRILVASAVPPVLPARMVEALCGSERALAVLEDLARRAFFVARRGREDPVFELHPLAREFLLERARAEMPPERLRALEEWAARLLAETGHVEDAIDLHLRAQAWADATHLVLLRAPLLAATGRTAKLEGWLEALGEAQAAQHPWLWYWRGVCRLAVDPATARQHLARAWEGFESAGDARGLHLAFAAAIESFVLEWNDLRGMDQWIDRFETASRLHPVTPGAEFAHRSATAILAALTFRRPGSQALSEWEGRALAVVNDTSLRPVARLTMGAYLLVAWAFRGKGKRAAEVVGTLAPLARAGATDPLVGLAWLASEALHFWQVGEPSRSELAASLGLQMARESGVHVWDFHLGQQRVLAAIAAGEPGRARQHMASIEACLRERRPLHDVSLLEMETLLALHAGDAESAARAVRAGRELAKAAGASGLAFAEALSTLHVAVALVEAGDPEARPQLEALRRGGTAWSALGEMVVELAQAELERRSGDLVAARAHLERGLRVSRERSIAPDLWFSRGRLAELCALAIDSDVESEHALALVRRLELAAPAGCASERWPWKLRIRLFGQYQVLVAGTPLRPSARARRRPLDVLPALVARGGHSATAQAIAAALWPESEGDLAHHALETAAHRLRRLLGHEVVQHREGEVRLDAGRCWVDALAFESLLAEAAALAQRRDGAGALAAAGGALALYRGPFLEGREEPWVLSARDRYRARLGRCLTDLDRTGADRQALLRLRARAAAADPRLADASHSRSVDRG